MNEGQEDTGSAASGAHGGEGATSLVGAVLSLLEYKWLIAIVTVGFVVAAFVWTSKQTRIYQAYCTLEYDPTPARPLGGKIEDLSVPMNYWNSREYFATQNKIIGSRIIAEKVVEKLDLHHDLDFLRVPADEREEWQDEASVSAAAEQLRGAVAVEQERDTRLVHIRVRDADPDRAARIANALADTYLAKSLDDRMSASTSALHWLAEQLDSLKRSLAESEISLHDFSEHHGEFPMPLKEQREIVAGKIEAYATRLAEAQMVGIELSAHLDALLAADRENPEEVNAATLTSDKYVASLRAALGDVRAEKTAFAVRYGPNHPDIKALETKEVDLASRLRQQIDGLIRGARLELEEAQRVSHGLEDALAEANRAGMRLEMDAISYRRLARERDNAAQLYETLLQRTTETDLTRALDVSYARVVDRALVPDRPISPRVPIALGVASVMGFLFAVALAMVLRMVDKVLRQVSDVEGLGLTVLGVLPAFDKASPASRRGWRRRSAVEVPSPSRDLLVHRFPQSPAAECCRTIRTNLTFMSADKPIRSLLITSSKPREGKSTLCLNLGIAMAQSGKRVLVVDTDLRRPRLHKALEIPAGTGVTSILAGQCELYEAVRETEVPGLFALPAGPIAPNPAELLHTSQFTALLAKAGEAYDLVIYDSPPLTAVTDAAVLAPQVDGVLVVVRADSTTRDALRSAQRQLRDVRSNVLGAVINSLELSANKPYAQGGYYYSSEQYGSEDEEGPPPPPSGTSAQVLRGS